MSAWRAALLVLPVLLQLAVAADSRAHGFGERYDLPLPLWMYLTGAGLTVALTFAFLAWQRRAPAGGEGAYSRVLLARVPGAAAAAMLLRLLVLALYLLVIWAGYAGLQSPSKNIAPAMVWAVWWVGMAYVSALIGDLWALVNPLDTLFRAFERLWLRVAGTALRPVLAYPTWMKAWPAVLLFFLFVLLELEWEGSEHPASLATAMLLYSALCWCAMALFGRGTWLRHGEVFAIVFGLLARFAPNHWQDGQWRLRPFAAGLLTRQPCDLSHIVLVMLMLASVSFDGMMETQPWLDLTGALPAWAMDWASVAALVLLPAGFLLVFLGCCRLIVLCGGGGHATFATAGLYVLTLVPISIAYHFAHYLSFLSMAVQYLIPLASDPLSLGWDLFGTRLYFIRLGIVDARLVWYVSLFAIVAAHVAAVCLAHIMALRQFGNREAALRSQYPMLALMVGYTLLSLWIIAQPIVSG
ncbi:MAG: hypothetical protein V4633_22610 [Pseudomonadota bacterium]